MIQKLWFYPPLAIARVGPSDLPCDSYLWGANDLRPRGTGKTTIAPTETLQVAEDGTVTASQPTVIKFKEDGVGFKPVCPFFELYGAWVTAEGAEQSGPLTPQVLALFGLQAQDLHWKVEVANLKAHHMTLNPADSILATVEISGDVTTRQELRGVSLPNLPQPLLPAGTHLPLGSIQLTKPTEQFPEFRLRFTPAKGFVYGPVNLAEREVRPGVAATTDYQIPPARRIFNPNAPWCQFFLTAGDPRTNPGGLFATDGNGQSLGLVDDVCDGIIRCSVAGLTAVARVTVGPPDYAPDRRPFTSLADGLADRVKRAQIDVEDMDLTTREVRDLMERVLETMELINLDEQNNRVRGENQNLADQQALPPDAAADKAFPALEPVLGRPLPLTEYGRQRHRRYVSLEVFEDILREQPDLITEWIREPMTGDKYYDRRMPALMRGSDRYPMHITRRQYHLLVAWVNRLRQEAEEGS